jgi:hypothetical protein
MSIDQTNFPFDDPIARISCWGNELRKDQFLLLCNKLDTNTFDGVKDRLQRYGLCVIRRTGAGWSTKPPSKQEHGNQKDSLDPNILWLQDVLGSASSDQSETEAASKLIVTNKVSDKLSGNNPGPLAPHTDGSHLPMPPPIVILQYLQTADVGGMLSFIDFAKVIQCLFQENHKSSVNIIKSLQGTKAVCINKPVPSGDIITIESAFLFEVPYYKSLNSYGCRGRFDDKVVPCNYNLHYFEALREIIKNKDFIVRFIPEPADIVVIDNWRVLHGRSAYDGIGERAHRRMWIESLNRDIQESIALGIRPLNPSRLFLGKPLADSSTKNTNLSEDSLATSSQVIHNKKTKTNLYAGQVWDSFVGREIYQQQLRDKLSLSYKSEVYIKGLSGVGKTTLVKKVAQEYFCQDNSEFDYVLFYSAKKRELTNSGIKPVPASTETAFFTLEQLAIKISRVCGIWLSNVGPKDQEDRLRRFLTSGKYKLLIIIDNFETLSKQERQNIWIFFKDIHMPDYVKVVYTARSLELATIEISPLEEDEAREMVRSRELTLSRANIDDLIRYCDRVPLAIEWAIAMLKNGYSINRFKISHTSAYIDEDDDNDNGDGELLKYMFDDLVGLIKERNPFAYNILLGMSVTRYPLGKRSIQFIAGITKQSVLNKALEILVEHSLANVDGNDQYVLKSLAHKYASGLFDSAKDFKDLFISRWIEYFLEFTLQNGGDDWDEWRNTYCQLDAYWENIQEVFGFLRRLWLSNNSCAYLKSKELWSNLLRFSYLYGYWAIRERWTDDLLKEAEARGDIEFHARLLAANGWIYLLREGADNYLKASRNFSEAIDLLSDISEECSQDLIEIKWTIYLNFAAARVRQQRFADARQLFQRFISMWIHHVKRQKPPRICFERRHQSRFFLRYLLYWGEYFYRYALYQRGKALSLESSVDELRTEGNSEEAENNIYEAEKLRKSAKNFMFKAESCYRRVAKLSGDIQWIRFQAKAMERIAYLKVRDKRFREASVIINEWMSKSSIHGDKRRVAFFIKDKALLHEGLNEFTKALECAAAALAKFQELDMDQRVKEVSKMIIRLKNR